MGVYMVAMLDTEDMLAPMLPLPPQLPSLSVDTVSLPPLVKPFHMAMQPLDTMLLTPWVLSITPRGQLRLILTMAMEDTDTMVPLLLESPQFHMLASPSRDILMDMDSDMARGQQRLILSMVMVDTDTTDPLHLDFLPSPMLVSPSKDMLRDTDTDGERNGELSSKLLLFTRKC